MTDNKPRFDDAPGLVVRPAPKGTWEARWQCRTDLLGKGFKPASRRLWTGLEPSDIDRSYVSDQANRLQGEMHLFNRGGLPEFVVPFDGTLKGLIRCYQSDPDSKFHGLRYQIRINYSHVLRRLENQYGDVRVADIKARVVLAWYKDWGGDGTHLPMAKTFIGMLRMVMTFGTVMLEDPECMRLRAVLSAMRFTMPKPRKERMTAEMVIAVRKKAHEWGWHSIAFAQALQFDLMLRQKDVIGEWIPISEPGVSDIVWSNQKWMHGLRWTSIDQGMILRHVTSKTSDLLEINLHRAEMVLEEIQGMIQRDGALPTKGALVRAEQTGKPWFASEFRRKWRWVAKAAGVPDKVRNQDTRAGAISEATDAGAPLEHVRHAATHADIGMTQRYSRGAAEKVDNVMQIRSAHRNKPRTGD